MRKPIRLFIATPSGNMVHAKYNMSLVRLVFYITNKPFDAPWRPTLEDFRYYNPHGSILSKLREDLIEDAIRLDSTHVLFIDSDMEFPPDLLHRLLAHDKDCVAVNCAIKSADTPAFTARNLDEKGKRIEVVTRPPGYNHPSLERVWRIGTGIMLVTVAACKKIKQPRFPITWGQETQTYTGEDWNFVDKLHREARVSTWVDHDLSWEVSHHGDVGYNPELVCQHIQYEQWYAQEQLTQKAATGGK